MKLLFDQNISFRVVKGISQYFPDSKQVKELALENAKDMEIWRFAKKEKYVIVTFDADFYDFSIVKGTPPKVIWLRTGNTKTKNIEQLLISKRERIIEFCEGEDMVQIGCLEITD